ncbi:amidase [Bordetella sp. H567]|uniref:amidase n=1 Tax=Bordetella sp. H567 TaxID=1697043 RepID=UPI00081CA2B3|nr:amidase [Bordetella sp. H567]AOB31847.1 amidase [Bordetella sp. H567]
MDTVADSVDSRFEDPSYRPLWQCLQALESGAVTAEQLVDACEQAFKVHHARVNALPVHDYAAARTAARAADAARRRGETLGPLHGIPFSIKESFDVAGWPTTCGDPAHAQRMVARDSDVVRRLRDAGAILVGKSNVPLHLRDWQSYNALYGTTRNPHDLSRTPGGSSGGSAAAVCTGMSVFDIGSDIGSSVRNPAHYCGVFSHKSSHGLISLRGHGINGTDESPDINVAGPIARSARDLELLLRVLACDAGAGAGPRLPFPGEEERAPRDFRVAVLPTHPYAPVDGAVSAIIEDLGRELEGEGLRVSWNAQPAIDAATLWRTYVLMLRAATSLAASDAAYQAMRDRARHVDPDDLSYAALQYVGATLDHRGWLKLAGVRRGIAQAWTDFFASHDVLLCPAAATPAFELNETGEPWQRHLWVNGEPQPMTTQLFWAGYSGLCGLPSTVAPAGRTADGLPVGVQIVAGRYHDLTSLRFAQWLEAHGHAFQPPVLARTA